MTAQTHHFGIESEADAFAADAGSEGPTIDQTYWGYAIRDDSNAGNAGLLAGIGGRFFGVILLMAAAGLWLMPDALKGADVFAMKLAAMVMFTVFGGYFIWAGQGHINPEVQIDTARGELRVGGRSLRGEFRLQGMLAFSDVGSVFLLRSKDRTQPTRLFLRLVDGKQALEIAAGSEGRLELLRDRLTQDLTRTTREALPLETQLARHAVMSA